MATKGRQLSFSLLWILSVLVNGIFSARNDSISHSEDVSKVFIVTSSPDTVPSLPIVLTSTELSITTSPDPTPSSTEFSSAAESSSTLATPTFIPSPSSPSSMDVSVPSSSTPAISTSSSVPVVVSSPSASPVSSSFSSSAPQPSLSPVPDTSGIGLAGIVGIAVAVAVTLILVIVAIVVALAVCHFTVNRKGHYATKEDDIRETSLLRHNASLRSMKSNVSKQETEYYL